MMIFQIILYIINDYISDNEDDADNSDNNDNDVNDNDNKM